MSTTITEDHVKETCQPGKGSETCAYLMMSPDGWECAKDSAGFEAMIDKRLRERTIRAQGNNCPGWFLVQVGKLLKVSSDES